MKDASGQSKLTFYEALQFLASTHQSIKGGGYSDGLVIDLTKRSVRSKSLYLMKNGIIQDITVKISGKEITFSKEMPLIHFKGDSFKEAQVLFERYYVSVPNEYSGYCKSSFPTKQNLNQRELMDNNPRQVARIALEGFILCATFDITIVKGFYWQCPTNKDFLLYKNWITSKEGTL